MLAAHEAGMGAVELARLREAVDIDFIQDDLPQLLQESEDGLTRVKKIVQDLKDFSRVDQADWQDADLDVGRLGDGHAAPPSLIGWSRPTLAHRRPRSSR